MIVSLSAKMSDWCYHEARLNTVVWDSQQSKHKISCSSDNDKGSIRGCGWDCRCKLAYSRCHIWYQAIRSSLAEAFIVIFYSLFRHQALLTSFVELQNLAPATNIALVHASDSKYWHSFSFFIWMTTCSASKHGTCL